MDGAEAETGPPLTTSMCVYLITGSLVFIKFTHKSLATGCFFPPNSQNILQCIRCEIASNKTICRTAVLVLCIDWRLLLC